MRPAPKPAPPAPPAPPPELVVRAAREGDAAAIAELSALAGGDSDFRQIEKRISAALQAGEPLLVADQAGVIAVLHGHVITTIHHGPVGHVTVIVVAQGDRRRGIGTTLLKEVVAVFARSGCRRVEAMSEIAVRNANGFLRALGFAEASYCFTRDI